MRNLFATFAVKLLTYVGNLYRKGRKGLRKGRKEDHNVFMTQSNHNDFVPAMAEIAREAGALLMEYFQQHVKVEYKGDADLVTIADRKSEILIRERIKARWPSHDILGEEQGLVDTGSDYRWYVDPLDGTTNFAHGFPVFCVSLGLEHKNRLSCRRGLRSHAR